MKNYTKKGIWQKILISIAIVMMLTNIVMPLRVSAVFGEDYGGTLLRPVTELFVAIGDGAMMLACSAAGGSSNIGATLTDLSSYINSFNEILVPSFSVSPEKIFANEVPLLNVNIINPEDGSVASVLQETIANWYRTFRNLAAVGLLSVLVYISIRIIISSTVSDKTKYKTMLKDWFVAFCLLFFMHYIISFSITIVDTLTKSLKSAMPTTYNVQVDLMQLEPYQSNGNYRNYFDDEGNMKNSGLMELVRFKLNFIEDPAERVGLTIIYCVLVVYTVMFLFVYIKRMIYIIFLTMLSPLVALSYPLDKVKDGSAQGFNTWFKEFIFNLLLQPLHLLLYYVLIVSALDLSVEHPLYAVIVMGCMLQAEKVLRQLFGFDKAKSVPSPLGGLVGGAALMKGFGALQKGVAGLAGKGSSKGNSEKIRTANQHRKPNNPNIDLFDELPTDENIGKQDETFSDTYESDNSKFGFSPSNSIGDGLGRPSNTKIGNGGFDPDNSWGLPPVDQSATAYNKSGYVADYEKDGRGLYLKKDRSEPPYRTAIRQKGTGDKGFDEFAENRRKISDKYRLPKFPVASDIGGAFIKGFKDLKRNAKFTAKGTGAVLRKYGPDAAKKIGKGALKIGTRGFGIATGATLGAIAGLATDDMSNVLKFGAAGAVGGNELGKGAVNYAGALRNDFKESREKAREVGNTFVEANLTPAQIRERQNKILDREYRKNKENQLKFKEAYKGKTITIDGRQTEYWKYAMDKSQEFRNYGVDDIDTIIKMQKAMDKKGMDIADHKGIMAAQLVGQAKDEKGVEIVGKRLKDKKNIADKQIKEIQDLIRAHNDTL